MFRIKKESGWKYVTSAGGSVSYAFVGAGTGHFILTNPTGGNFTFNYASVGAGLSVGGKFSYAGSTEATFRTGQIYLVDTFSGGELTSHDIEGFCLIDEVSAAAGIGGSLTVMLLGIPLQ